MPEGRGFLLATFEGGSPVMPVLSVAAKLSRRRHRVRPMSGPCNRPESEAAGACFMPWRHAPGKPRRDRNRDAFRDWDAPNPLAGSLRLMDELRVGLALLAMNLPLFPLPGWPPSGVGLPPARDAAAGVRHAVITALPRLNATRLALGLHPLRHPTDQHENAAALLLATSRAFDFEPHVPSPRVHYGGPQLDDPHWAGSWKLRLLPRDHRPLVLASFSTTLRDHAGAVQRVIDALAGLEVRAVVTLGGSLRREELRASGNVLLREAVLVVTHGGHGTVTKALLHGRSLLIPPHGHDQDDNAIRVTGRSAGLALRATQRRKPSSRHCSACCRSRVSRRRHAGAAPPSPAAELLEELAAAQPVPAGQC